MAPMLAGLYFFLIGLCIGSFLNVCIFRLPAGRSIVHPPSACPTCGNPIRWYDNIPVFSWLLLRGRCRGCGSAISARYPIVELLTGLLALAVWLRFGWHIQTPIYFALTAALIVITFIDLDHRIIPDVISLPGIPIGFACSFLLPHLHWRDSLIGIVVGGGSLLVVAWGYRLLTGKEGMGGGDIKMLAMLGAFIGWQGVFFTIMASSFIGTTVGIALMIRMGKDMKLAVPFGPFLAIGALLYLFFGPRLIDWYLYGFLMP
ncbi:prepilin peptidase [Desulfatitalea alkaliphila]|uniref:Prepilin leader peptidase/N-methyltransferase n=1 Tax=Desulfatitalea alkaliphila TaxID=2929485 RepID=A0AA41R616_9BACT|nr:A24 family peptidase [Desulfatitalea alkaliphila]MCJ8501730.1 prepilin peptidase [Desulfatitalea alkaliphila]